MFYLTIMVKLWFQHRFKKFFRILIKAFSHNVLSKHYPVAAVFQIQQQIWLKNVDLKLFAKNFMSLNIPAI